MFRALQPMFCLAHADFLLMLCRSVWRTRTQTHHAHKGWYALRHKQMEMHAKVMAATNGKAEQMEQIELTEQTELDPERSKSLLQKDGEEDTFFNPLSSPVPGLDDA